VHKHVADIVYGVARKPRYNIKTSVAEIAVDKKNLFADGSHRHCKIGAHRRFADAALAGGK